MIVPETRPFDELPSPPNPMQVASKNRVHFQLTGYEILEELGHGGMGVVYKARQISLDRPVALKMIRGMAAAEELARFKIEADACAQLHHPNIVQIFEIGERDGQPFIALEFVEGGTLAHHLAGKPMEPSASARLVATLARAIQFAHAHKIIHRDLKPANVLLAKTDRGDLQSAIPKIADFGLAKRLDQDGGQTRSGSIMGTPNYMAPEQAQGGAIGPAADGYALGAMLYEMLTGRPPFHGVTPLETVQQVLHDEPVPPRRLQPGVPFDLETICLKCLEKESGQRYASADALADDLARFLAGQPILARTTSWHERTLKWVKRRPALAGAIAASALAALLFVGLTVGAYFNARLQESLEETERERARAERFRYFGQINLGQGLWDNNQVPRLLSLLQEADRRHGGLRSFEWHYQWGLCHTELFTFAEHKQPVKCIVVSPNGDLVASGSGESVPGVKGFGEVHLWEASGEKLGKIRHTLKGHKREVISAAFSTDGKLLATGSKDATVRLWEVASGAEVFVLERHKGNIACVAFHPKENLLATGSDDTSVILWNVTTGKPVREMPKRIPDGIAVTTLAFSPDGTRLIYGCGDARKPGVGEIREWELKSDKAALREVGQHGGVWAVAFSPDGKTIASAGDHATYLWNLDGRVLHELPGKDRVTCLCFDAAGKQLATGGVDMSIRVWDPARGVELVTRKGHAGIVRGVAFSRDGERMLSANDDHAVKIWNSAGEQEYKYQTEFERPVSAVAFSPAGRTLVSTSFDSVNLWNVRDQLHPRDKVISPEGPLHCVATVPKRSTTKDAWLLIAGGDNGVRIWDMETREDIHFLKSPNDQIRAIAVSADGSRLAYAGICDRNVNQPAAITVWDLHARQTLATLKGHLSQVTSLAFSHDGRILVSASSGNDGVVKWWNVSTGHEFASIALGMAGDPRIALSADGRWLAIADGLTKEGTIRIHDARTRTEKLRLVGHQGVATAVTFTPDSERLATSDGTIDAGQVTLWDVQTGHEVLTLRGHAGVVHSLAFSGDGRALACSGGSLNGPGQITLWDCGRKKAL